MAEKKINLSPKTLVERKILFKRAFIWISFLLMSIIVVTACKGRKIRAELVILAKAIEESRDVGNSIAQKIEGLKYSSPQENEVFIQKVDDLIGQIYTLLEPIQELKFETVEVTELKDLYASSWGSLMNALILISDVIKNRDEKLAQAFPDRLSANLNVYNQSITLFQQKYRTMLEKYGVTGEDIGPMPVKPAVTPSPFSSSPLP